MKKVLGIIVLAIWSLTFSGCGGGGGSSSSSGGGIPSILSAYLSDSRIAGVTYTCGTQIGVTDSEGHFEYSSECSNVIFSLGGVSLGSIPTASLSGNAIMYPADLVSVDRNETNSTKLTNLLQFFQSLDSDNNPNNGITIDAAIATALVGDTLDLRETNTTLLDVNTTLSALGLSLVKRDYAIAHYEDTLRSDLNETIRTVPPAPAIFVSGVRVTKYDSVTVILHGAREAKVYVDGTDSTIVMDINRSAQLNLDTSGMDGDKSFTITLVDENNDSSDDLNITILKDTQAPSINVTNSSIDENIQFSLDVNATDVNGNINYSLSGTDASYFDINATSGVLTLKESANYEEKSSYNLNIVATDRALNTTTKVFVLSINPINDIAPFLTSSTLKTVNENFTGIAHTLSSADADLNTIQTFTYSIFGVDADKFDLDTISGEISFKSSPDFESRQTPYSLTAKVNDGIFDSIEQNITISVVPLNDIAPVITPVTSKNINENFVGTLLTLTSSDADLNITQTFTYSMSGADATSFDINSATGVITFITSPDYETRKLPYNFSVKVNDGIFDSVEHNVTIGINPLNDIAPAFTLNSIMPQEVDENFVGNVLTLESTDADQDQNQTFTYSISGLDAAYFNLNANTGALSFKTSPNYEQRQNPYVFDVKVNDGVNESAVAPMAILINHLNDELPVITNVVVEQDINENMPISTVVIEATSSDLDIDENQIFSYVLGGVDSANFNIDSSNGQITFRTSPDYENPLDADKNNQYQLTVNANDGLNTGPISNLLVRLNNIDDVPTPLGYNGVVRGSVNYGYIIVNALVILQDANKNLVSVYTDAYGNYRFNLGSNFVGPFILKSYLPTGEILYSYNDGAHEVTNITPITTLMVNDFIVDLGLSDNLEEFFNGYAAYYTTYSANFATIFNAVYIKISAYFSASLSSSFLTGFNHLYNTFYSYGFDYDNLLSSANMYVSSTGIIIRHSENVYASDTTRDYSGNIAVKGRVLNSSGIAISSASVSVVYNGTTLSVTTDSSGYYSINVPKYVKYDMAIVYSGKTLNYYSLSTFLDANNSSDTEINIEEAQFVDAGTSTLSGKIVNVNNNSNAVANASVKVREGYNNQTSSVLKTVQTDVNGNFSVELDNGNYTFEYSKSSWTTKYETVYVNATQTLSNIEIGLITDVFGISLIGADMLASSDSGASDSDNITNDSTPTIAIDQEANLLVKNAAFVTVQEINTSNAADVTLSTLSDGTYTIVGTDSQGNATGFTLLAFTIDTTTVLKPTINLHSSTDSGVSDSDNITKSNPIQIRGTAEVNSTIVLKDGNRALKEITVDASGDYLHYIYSSNYYYNYSSYSHLDDGEYNLTVTATDIAGNIQVSDILELVIDRTGAPLTNIDMNASSDSGRSSTDNYTNDTTPTFTTDQNVTLDVRDSSGTILQSIYSSYLNNYTVTLNSLIDGVYKITSGDINSNTDIAGNTLNYSFANFTIDTVTNALTLDMYYRDDKGISNSDNVTNYNDIRIETGGEVNSVVTIYDGLMSLGSGTVSYYYGNYDVYLNNLLDGNYTLTANVVDLAGNENNATTALEIEIDTVGIVASTIDLDGASDTGYSPIDNITNDTTPTFSTSKEVTLRAINTSDSSLVQEVDTTVLPSGMYTATFAALADGVYKIESGLTGTDTAGNSLGYNSINVTIDTTIATPTIDLDVTSDSGDGDSDNITNDNTPTITGSTDEYSKIIIKDVLTELEILNTNYASYSDYENGNWKFRYGVYNTALSELSDGNHTLNVTVYDKAGNEATATLEVEIDTVGVPSVEMDIVGSEIDIIAIMNEINSSVSNLEKIHSLQYYNMQETYWENAGNYMYANGNYLYVDGVLQDLWETSNNSDRNATNFGNYTLRTNPNSLVLFVENFQGEEFKITGNSGHYGNTVEYGELESVNGLKVYYHQVYSTNNYYPTINHIVITNAKNPTFNAITNNSRLDEFTLSNIEEGASVVYVLFGRKNDYNGDKYNYSKAELQEIVNNLEVVANATNDSTPTIVTDTSSTITIKDDANTTLQTISTAVTNSKNIATLTTLSDGRYVAQIGSKGTDVAGNLLSYTAMPFVVDTVISTPTLDLNATSDSGDSDSDNITNQTVLTLDGVAEAGVKIEIKDASDTILATVYSNSDGNYTLDLVDLSDGVYALSSVTTDAASNSQTATMNLTVDTFGDTLIEIAMDSASDTGNSNSDQITGDTTPTMTTDRASTLTILDESNATVQTLSTSSNEVTLSTLSDGVYRVEGGDRGTDVAGNTLSYNTTTIQIDTSAPVLTSPTELDNNSTITASSLHVYNTATSDASEVTYILGGLDSNYFTIDAATGIITLSDIATSGTAYEVTVTATDVVGNSDTYDITITPQVITPLDTAKIENSLIDSTAVYGDYVIAGDEYDGTISYGAGAVFVYKKSTDGLLKQIAKLTASNASSYDYFGSSVAIDGNYIVVGAYGANSAYLYEINADDTISEVSIMTASDGLNGYFGNSVDIDGNHIIIGANLKSGASSYEGAAHIYKINSDNTTTEIAKLKASDAEYNDYFGYSVSISEDKIVVGAYQEDAKGSNAGAAYVYKIETNESVSELAKITASDTITSDYFGYSVSISGDKILVGAYSHTPISSAYNAGAAYLFNIDSNDKIMQIAKLTASDLSYNSDYDSFGISTSIYGDYLVVGANSNSYGSIYLYKIDNENSVTELSKISSSDNSTSGSFGQIVSTDGDSIAILSNDGIYLYDIFANKPYIPTLNKTISIEESLSRTIYTVPFSTNVDVSEISYTLSGDDADKFTISDKQINSNSALDFESPTDADLDNSYDVTLNLEDLEGRVNSYDLNISVTDTVYFKNSSLKANDAAYGDNLGVSIAIDGDYVLSGAPNEDANGESNAGSAYLFKKDVNGELTQVSKLTASDGAYNDKFGSSIAISGNYAVIGSSYKNNYQGAAYLFKINSDGTTTQLAIITASDAIDSDFFAYSVAISGEYIVVGSRNASNSTYSDIGAAYLFKIESDDSVTQMDKVMPSDGTNYDYFGSSVSIDGDYIVVGSIYENSASNNAGAVYVYKKTSGGSLAELTKLKAPSANYNGQYGNSVSISGDYIVVGEYGAKKAYLYKNSADSISLITELTTQTMSYFGYSVSVNSNTISIGDYGQKSISIFSIDTSDSVTEVEKITKGTGTFGYSVDISGTNIVIGDKDEDTIGSNSGAIYLYTKDTNQP